MGNKKKHGESSFLPGSRRIFRAVSPRGVSIITIERCGSRSSESTSRMFPLRPTSRAKFRRVGVILSFPDRDRRVRTALALSGRSSALFIVLVGRQRRPRRSTAGEPRGLGRLSAAVRDVSHIYIFFHFIISFFFFFLFILNSLSNFY